MKTTKLIVLSLLLVSFNSCSDIEKNKKTGNTIIEKIELYKKTNGYPPDWLQSIGYEEYDFLGLHGDSNSYITDTTTSGTSVIKVNGEIFCYRRIDSVNYMVWFGTTLGEGIYYYSDSQQWEERLRGIGNWEERLREKM
jgi:hypothetical protein